MSRIRTRNTAPELALRKALRSRGLIGYRLNYAKAPGRPDVAFVGRKVAVFVHGCFWHACPHCALRKPKSNTEFWTRKLNANKARDARKVRELRKAGWRVLTVWECRLKKNADAEARRVEHVLAP